jgi:chemotaxis protein methyltransferase WspC
MPSTNDDILAAVFQLLRDRAGIDPELFGAGAIAHTIEKRLAANGAAAQDYANCLRSDAAEFQELLEDLLVPETWLFRDALALRSLQRYLNAWLSRHSEPIRVLSVACSTGEEVLSLAMTLREAGLPASRFEIVGTDVSRRSLEIARRGELGPRSFRERDDTTLAVCGRWCRRTGDCWQIGDELLKGINFKWGNLARADFLADEPPFHAIFCRNVLIYFHADGRRTAVENLHRLLAADGLLCSAPAEARIFTDAGFCAADSQCPFAFQRPGALADAPVTADPAMQLREKKTPLDAGFQLPEPVPGRPIPAPAPCPPLRPKSGPTGALIAGTNADQVEPTSLTILDAARQAADNGRLDEADALCAEILSRDPSNCKAHYLRGVVLQAQGLLSEAQRSLEKALYLEPKHYEALIHMMLLSEQRGDQTAAANYRRRAQQAALRGAE